MVSVTPVSTRTEPVARYGLAATDHVVSTVMIPETSVIGIGVAVGTGVGVDVGTGVGVAVAKEALGRYLDLLAVKNLSVSYKEGRRTSTHP
jgi:hypothetical protein